MTPLRKAHPSPPSRGTDVELQHFEETCELLRHYSGLRFRQLTIFVAINGGLLFALLRQGAAADSGQIFAVTGLGGVAAMAFVILEFRLNAFLDHYRHIVAAYERKFGLEYSLYHDGRGWLVRGRLAILLFIASTSVAWGVIGYLAAH